MGGGEQGKGWKGEEKMEEQRELKVFSHNICAKWCKTKLTPEQDIKEWVVKYLSCMYDEVDQQKVEQVCQMVLQYKTMFMNLGIDKPVSKVQDKEDLSETIRAMNGFEEVDSEATFFVSKFGGDIINEVHDEFSDLKEHKRTLEFGGVQTRFFKKNKGKMRRRFKERLTGVRKSAATQMEL